MTTEVNPEMLTLAREIRGMTQKELSQRSGVQQGKISRYEGGIVDVTEKDITRLSAALEFPEEFFYMVGRRYGVEPSQIFHRKRSSVSARVRKQIDALTNMHRIGAGLMLDQFEQISDFTIPSLYMDDYTDVDEIAATVRAVWRIPPGPIDDLMWHVEHASCLIFSYDFGSEKIDETTQWIEPSPPIMLINNTLPGDRVRFSMAHAIGHLVMHRHYPPSNAVEQEANDFAAAFLMPADDIYDELHPVTLQHLLDLKLRWKVSVQALIRRARDLGRISERRYRSLFQQLSRYGYRKAEPFPIPQERPQLVKQILDSYKLELGYSDEELAKMLCLGLRDYLRWYYPFNGSGDRKIIQFPTGA